MRMKKLLKAKRLISPLIATLILVGVAIAGGLLVYGLTSGMFGTLSARGEISVESIDLVKDTAGNVVFTITLKNSGNKPLGAMLSPAAHPLNITRPAEGTIYNVVAGAGLQPGRSVAVMLDSFTIIDPGPPPVYDLTAANYVIGNSYTVVIVARFTDGSLFTATVSVQCRAG